MNNTAELLTKYINIFHPNHKGMQGVPLFYNRNGDKLTRAGISYILSKYVNLAKQKQPSLIPKMYRHMDYVTVKACTCCKQEYR